MTDRIEVAGLKVARELYEFVETEALPGSGVASGAFWQGLAGLAAEMGPKNRALLEKRDAMQAALDDWHLQRRGQEWDAAAYRAYLEEIGYLLPEGPDFAVETAHVDPEIAAIPGPQLVVPVMNARYALNAANARWGSLYDALYGTDALGTTAPAGGYDAAYGAKVIARAKAFLDRTFPLAAGSHADVTAYENRGGVLYALQPEGETGLSDPTQFAGFTPNGAPNGLAAIVLKNNGLHVVVQINPEAPIGKQDKAGVLQEQARKEDALHLAA